MTNAEMNEILEVEEEKSLRSDFNMVSIEDQNSGLRGTKDLVSDDRFVGQNFLADDSALGSNHEKESELLLSGTGNSVENSQKKLIQLRKLTKKLEEELAMSEKKIMLSDKLWKETKDTNDYLQEDQKNEQTKVTKVYGGNKLFEVPNLLELSKDIMAEGVISPLGVETGKRMMKIVKDDDVQFDISSHYKNTITKESKLDVVHGPKSVTMSAIDGPILEQQSLMEESGMMMGVLRKEVMRLRSDNSALRKKLDTVNESTKRLMGANAAAKASFSALNDHAIAQRDNALVVSTGYQQQIQELLITQQEMRDELQMKQTAYINEFHARLRYEDAMSKIVDIIQDRCRDSRLVEDILQITDEVEEHKDSEETVNILGSSESSHRGASMVGRLTSLFS
mmetsp:Transcript_30679/g.34969  ORF Transcript_30679/g.34969 Transcript_30679/m.34969 type:complete len:395 (-) Transcript_30679:281-1465(-)|eukprot:CAMPEP_0194132026 /NCGR_PEP_ID=MMETSP0152-20130528/2598_1 /TAXON_ID=1049557 /ORGANISM="Thalassiothrix antarctica, Strain L6-D1" /LENGTH=394 /DNA_ID=CAMNT_0038826937 /DNA_START=125 /DNA_END=1312 /DNA_ORIENTATION=+